MKKGFTLIELLVVISIITVLSTIGLTVFQGVQKNARDSVRKNDLNQLSTALELYYQKNNRYLSGVTQCQTDPNASTFYESIRDYMSNQIVPVDPSTKLAYCYISSDGSTFTVCAELENSSDADINNPTACPDYNFGITPK